jgi:hypothetical protein
MVEVSGENFKKYCEIISGIDSLLSKIKLETGGYSTSYQTFKHPGFLELVNMGDRIIPYLFHKITHYGSSWLYFHLLGEITGENPVPREYAGNFYYTILYWLNWYIKNKYFKNDDVYFGLIDQP